MVPDGGGPRERRFTGWCRLQSECRSPQVTWRSKKSLESSGQVIDYRAQVPDGLWTHPTEPSEPWRPRPLSLIDEFSIHHTTSPNGEWTEQQERDHVYSIYLQHKAPGRFAPDWKAPGIGYWYLIFPSGNTYWVGDLETQRAAVGGHNHHIVAAALVGLFSVEYPTDQAIEAAHNLRLYLQDLLSKTLNRNPHSFWNATSCPGATHPAWIERI